MPGALFPPRAVIADESKGAELRRLLDGSSVLASAGPQNPLTWISGAVDRFGESHITTFVSLGNNLYTAFALILIVWTGIQVALSSHFQPNQFAKLVLLLAFGKAHGFPVLAVEDLVRFRTSAHRGSSQSRAASAG